MKKYLFFNFILLLFFLSCGKEPRVEAPYKAKIVTLNSFGQSVYKVVSFKTLKNLKKMQGDYADLFGAVKIHVDENNEENPLTISSKKSVSLDYRVKNKVVYPLNFDSHAFLSIYWNIEKTFEFWQKNFDLGPEKLGKISLFYEPEFLFARENSKYSLLSKVNASFFPGSTFFAFYGTSSLEELPIKMDLSVFAHEFGHFIFDYFFAAKEYKTYLTDKAFSSSQELSGINEGFADFCSWLVSKSTNPLELSLPFAAEERKIPSQWTSKQLKDKKVSCRGGFYCKGSVLTSSLYELSHQKGQDPIKVMKKVLKALPEFRKDWDQYKNKEGFDYFYLLNRIIEQADEGEEQKLYRRVFAKWFDDELNLKEISL